MVGWSGGWPAGWLTGGLAWQDRYVILHCSEVDRDGMEGFETMESEDQSVEFNFLPIHSKRRTAAVIIIFRYLRVDFFHTHFDNSHHSPQVYITFFLSVSVTLTVIQGHRITNEPKCLSLCLSQTSQLIRINTCVPYDILNLLNSPI